MNRSGQQLPLSFTFQMEERAPPPALGFPGRRAPRLSLGPHGTGSPPLILSGATAPRGPDDTIRTAAVCPEEKPWAPALRHAHSPPSDRTPRVLPAVQLIHSLQVPGAWEEAAGVSGGRVVHCGRRRRGNTHHALRGAGKGKTGTLTAGFGGRSPRGVAHGAVRSPRGARGQRRDQQQPSWT